MKLKKPFHHQPLGWCKLAEREVYDLMGIKFSDHPDLVEFLCPMNIGAIHSEKDFPIQGIGEDYLIDELLAEHEENI